MLHTYRDAITGEVYQVYDDEPPDHDDPEDSEEETEPEDDFEEEAYRKYDREVERYLDWLYGE